MASDTWMVRPNMINVARVSMNRIDASPTVTSGLSVKDLGFNINPSNATAAGLPFVRVTGFFTTGDAQQPFAGNAAFVQWDSLRGTHPPGNAAPAEDNFSHYATRWMPEY